MDAVKGREIPLGLSVDVATKDAKAALRRMTMGAGPVFGSPNGPTLADELHAMCRVIAEGDESCKDAFRSLTTLYGAVNELSWPDDVFDEKSVLLAKISYLAWLNSRRVGMYSELMTWEKLTAKHAVEQEPVRAFLALGVDARTDQLNDRFLSDPSVLLATIAHLRAALDNAPLRCFQEASAIHRWLGESLEGVAGTGEQAYLSAEVELLLAGAGRLSGIYRDSEASLRRLDLALEEMHGVEDLRAKANYVRLTILHHRRRYEGVIEGLPALEEAFRGLSMGLYVAKCHLLKAVSLKEIGRESEARQLLDALIHDSDLQDKQIRALGLIGLAELDGRLGRFDLAMSRLAEAATVVDGECLPVAVAHLHGIRAEVLRDQGLLLLAADSYRNAVAVYGAAGMNAFAAYVRIVLAETLMAAGREAEAISEIVAALPVIDEEGLVREGLAAMALLRESVRRQQADPRALRDLREQLERMQREVGP